MILFYRCVAALAMGLTGLAFWPSLAGAQDAAPTAILVVDGSNSMNGRIAGDTAPKHVLVREALRRALPKIATGARIGLAAFGHRRTSDCTDAAMVAAPSADTAALMGELERFKPRGFSPVSLALREAAAPLAAAPGSGSILLVLDDLASCRTEDPCVTATELAARNPRLTISVLGLGLNPAAVERMTCVTNVARGRFANVQESRELDAALEPLLVAAAGVLAPPVPVLAKPAESRARARAGVLAAPLQPPNARGLQLLARLSPQGPVLDRPVRWRVVRDGEPDAAPPLHDLEQAVANLDLPAGRYRVTARIGSIERQSTVDVVETAPAVLPVVLDAALLHVSTLLTKAGPAAAGAVVTATPADGAAGQRHTIILPPGEEDVVLPAGQWRLAAELGHARAERPLAVKAGEIADIELSLEAGRLSLNAEGSAANLRYAISEDDPDSPEGRREVTRSAAPAPNFVLPAGAYNLSVRRGTAEIRDRVVIKAGDDQRRRIAFGSARIRVTSRLPGAADRPLPVATRLVRLDGAEREIARSTDPEAVFDLAPGRYRVEARLGGQNAVTRRDVEIRGDGEQRIVMEHAAGTVQLRAVGAPAGLQFGEVFWTILDGAGQPVWHTGQAEPLAVLAAGRYVARVEARGTQYERQFDIRSGDTARLDVGG